MSVSSLFGELSRELKVQVERHYGISIDHRSIKFESPPDPDLGDIGLGCFMLAKQLNKSPVSIAEELARAKLTLPYVISINPAGPYLNLIIDAPALLEAVHTAIDKQGETYGHSNIGTDKRIMIEYSAPNTNKPQHLGHIRNNVLGMAISNIFEAVGYDVARVNLVNDRGIHICKSMLAYEKWGNGITPSQAGKKGDHFVGDYYVMFEQKAKVDPSLIDMAQHMLQKWEQGDKEVMTLWKRMNGWVYEGFEETYERLECSFEKVYYESETYKLGKDIVFKGLKDNILKKNESGEIVVDLSELDSGEKVLLRSDDTSIYITQDLGTTVKKFTDFKLDRSVFVVASEQNLHFKILFHVLKLLGYEWADKCFHLSYGMVYLPEGKLKSREGYIIDADSLMDELHDLARKEILSRSREMDKDELEYVSEAVALGALKYFILKVHHQKDIHFLPEESLSFDGATGPFAQYSFARLSSILRKGKKILNGGATDFSLLGNQEEKNIGILLAQYPDVVLESAEMYNPARIAAWIFDIARAINKFHHLHSVLNTGDSALTIARGALVRIARQVLGNGLKLLGIMPLERM